MEHLFPHAHRDDLKAAHKENRHLAWLVLGAIVVVVLGIFALLAVLLKPGPPGACNFLCRRGVDLGAAPPMSEKHSYTSSAYGFSIQFGDFYNPPDSTNSGSIGWAYTRNSDGAPLDFKFSGQQGEDPARMVRDAFNSGPFTDAKWEFDIPGAEIGYVSGFGSVYDEPDLAPNAGQAISGRVIIMAAHKVDHRGHDVGVVLYAYGPTSGQGGHPNPTASDLGDYTDTLVNSVTWSGDPAP